MKLNDVWTIRLQRFSAHSSWMPLKIERSDREPYTMHMRNRRVRLIAFKPFCLQSLRGEAENRTQITNSNEQEGFCTWNTALHMDEPKAMLQLHTARDKMACASSRSSSCYLQFMRKWKPVYLRSNGSPTHIATPVCPSLPLRQTTC